MSAENERLRIQASLHGPEGLNSLDRWRMKNMEADERRKTALAEQARMQQDRAAIAVVTEENAQLRADLDTLRAECARLNDELGDTNAAIGKIIDKSVDRFEQQDDEIRALKGEIADVRLLCAEMRVKSLDAVHANLVASAKMAVDTLNEATNLAARRVEVSQAEERHREELVALEARADVLANELERLRTHRDFKFAREEGDSDVFDLPHFLPPPRRDN